MTATYTDIFNISTMIECKRISVINPSYTH
nr:MAG TPA: hypothetical protein [Caudoviricetes sp.]DAK48689.1 MAG TPA: hypothetical protein [Caudoviricetes sp.]